MFARWRDRAISFTAPVLPAVMRNWLPRKTQVAQVELLAIVAAFEEFGPALSRKRVIALVDSEDAPAGGSREGIFYARRH